MPSFNPNIKFNITQARDIGLKFSLEIWQILTALTVILSVGSSLIWITNLQPQSKKQEFVFFDQAKADLYNLFIKTASINTQPPASIPKTRLKQICYTDVQSIQIEDTTEDRKVKNAEIENTLENLRVDFYDRGVEIPYENNFNDLLTRFDDFLVNSKLLAETQVLQLDGSLDIKKKITEICNSSPDVALEKISTMQESMSESKEKYHLSEEFITHINTWLKNSKEINLALKTQTDITQILPNIKALQEAFKQIFATTYLWSDKLSELKVYEEKFFDEMKKFEQWEKQYLIENGDMEVDPVYIFKSD